MSMGDRAIQARSNKLKTGSVNRDLELFYKDGYFKGADDAFRGLLPKHMSHLLSLSSVAIKYWEKGYDDGYRDQRSIMSKKRA